jgi:hypothetical protein
MLRKEIRKACRKWRFRPDHHQIDLLGDGQVENRTLVSRRDGVAGGVTSNAAVTGCADEMTDAAAAFQSPNEGVFAAT